MPDLPRDPDLLLRHVRLRWVGANRPGSRIFAVLGSTLAKGVLPNAQEATIYRALARLDGVTLTKGTTDIQGRPVLTLSHVSEGWLRQDILLDPETYTYRGHRSVVVKGHTRVPDGHGGTLKKGTIESQSALVAAGVVDQPGQRP
ncbi:hypothetical protein [Actinomadura sp. 3N508]|uniref:hypothetical protein n=1 Tax=Actinomadura sp. 3N508 TaxID=3375153 RepID=UPI00378D34CB